MRPFKYYYDLRGIKCVFQYIYQQAEPKVKDHKRNHIISSQTFPKKVRIREYYPTYSMAPLLIPKSFNDII